MIFFLFSDFFLPPSVIDTLQVFARTRKLPHKWPYTRERTLPSLKSQEHTHHSDFSLPWPRKYSTHFLGQGKAGQRSFQECKSNAEETQKLRGPRSDGRPSSIINSPSSRKGEVNGACALPWIHPVSLSQPMFPGFKAQPDPHYPGATLGLGILHLSLILLCWNRPWRGKGHDGEPRKRSLVQKAPKQKNHGSILPKQRRAEWPGGTKSPTSPDHWTPPVCKLLIPWQEIAREVARSKTESLQLSTHTVPLPPPCSLQFLQCIKWIIWYLLWPVGWIPSPTCPASPHSCLF